MDYFKSLRGLLKIEREEDRQWYLKLTESSSAHERRTNGLSWYPVAIRGSEMSRGDYLTVEVERTTHQDLPHQLRFGASAALFSNHNPHQDRTEGTISYVGGNRLKITLRTDELPDWSSDGKLGIDLLFDDNGYEEMQQALSQASALAEKPEEGRLIRILTGGQSPAAPDVARGTAGPHEVARGAASPPEGTLNPSQQAAVDMILAGGDLSIVHGPPGTGKTTTLVQAIKALLRQDSGRILVVAPSNAAVDLLSEKLSDEGVNVLRVGNPARVSERLISLTLDSKIAAHPAMRQMKKLRKQAAEYRDMAHKYKRQFGSSEREQRKALFDEARKIMKEVDATEQYIVQDLTGKAQVISATLIGAGHYTVRDLRYSAVVIDEAGQALEPACWVSVLKAPKVILAGDHCQLPPTIKSDEAARGGLSLTLLEKCIALHPETVTLLDEQYRMNRLIMGYSSEVFYEGKLRAHASVADHLLFPEDNALLFIDTAGCGFEERTEGTSTSNPEEAAFLFKHLSGFMGQWAEQATGSPASVAAPTIAVISPYKQQVQLLREQLDHFPELQSCVSVNTIDSFQGQERDIVYIGLTRSNADNKIGFLSEIRRMNVAMTRAREKLVVIGDSATLSRLPFYANFIAYAEKHGAYKSAWEFKE